MKTPILLFSSALLACSCSHTEEHKSQLERAADQLSESGGTEAPQAKAVVESFKGSRGWSFDDLAPGAVPAGWKIEATNAGDQPASWATVAAADAPSGGQVMGLEDTRGATGQTYNLLWSDDLAFRDGVIELAVQAGSGVEDQGGGPAWRMRDKDNYYVARWNPLEDNFRVYYVYDGRRGQLASAEVDLDPGTWHTIRIEHVGGLIRCSLDGEELLKVSDTTHLDPGGVGLWTKADAATRFDDLFVVGS